MKRWLGLVLVAACVTEDGDVLVDGIPLTACSQVPARMSDQQACTFTDVCVVTDPVTPSPACCNQLASCDSGTLRLDTYCEPGCTACADDHGCAAGRQLCDGNRCVACPDVSQCAPCAMGLVPLTRNGCATCTCAPPSECATDPADCNGEQCYPGLVCAPGCAPDDAGCCANTCAPMGCPSPAPLGCDTDCADPTCPTCVTGACDCVMGQWVCTAVCGDRTGICFQPT